EGGVGLEHRPVGGGVRVGLDEVIGDPQGVHAGLVGRAGDLTEAGAVVVRDADADAHVLTAFGSYAGGLWTGLRWMPASCQRPSRRTATWVERNAPSMGRPR